MSSSEKKKCRQYSVEYLAYGFIQSLQDQRIPQCLICEKTLTNESMRPSKLKNHLIVKHPDKKDESLEYFKKLRENFQKKRTIKNMFTDQSAKLDKGLLASYEISKLIAKAGKPHCLGESLIVPAISVVLSTVMETNPRQVTQCIPLSNSSVSRRIDEMANNVEEQLVAELKIKKFALQLDESTLRGNEALLMAYVRFEGENELVEEMLFARLLKTNTTGESIFREVNNYFTEKHIPLENIIACATDGAGAMAGKNKGFIAHLKKVVPGVFYIHCVIHREHLVAKNLGGKLHDALSIVIKTVNSIKSNALQDRLFQKFCEDNDENFKHLIIHTEVRWLSKGNCLRRFVTLWDSIITFIEDEHLRNKILDFKNDIFYLSDIFDKLNALNKQLQGRNSTLISAKGHIAAFMSKLQIYWANIARREFFQFPSMDSRKDEIKENDLLIYVNHLKNVHKEIKARFSDILEMNIPNWVINPFSVSPIDIEITLQEEIIELQNDSSANVKFNSTSDAFWVNSAIAEQYPQLCDRAKLFVVAFPSSYLVESAFSRVILLLTKQRNRLDIVNRGDLRLMLTSFDPNIVELTKFHQAQGSH